MLEKLWLPLPLVVVIPKLAGKPSPPVVVKPKAASPPAVFFWMRIVPRLVLLYVHVTVLPAASVIVAVDPLVLVVLVPVAEQLRFVRSQPLTAPSVTEYVPGGSV